MTTPVTGTTAADVIAWVAAAQGGDRAAFGHLYERYHPKVFGFIAYRVRSRETAEDLTADVFVKALNRIGGFAWQGRDPGAWFITIARNLVADFYKSCRYRMEVTAGDMPDEDEDEAAQRPDAAYGAYEAGAEAAVLLRQLTAEQRECLILRFACGYSVEQTARVMGRNAGVVKALTYRGTAGVRRAATRPYKQLLKEARDVRLVAG